MPYTRHNTDRSPIQWNTLTWLTFFGNQTTLTHIIGDMEHIIAPPIEYFLNCSWVLMPHDR